MKSFVLVSAIAATLAPAGAAFAQPPAPPPPSSYDRYDPAADMDAAQRRWDAAQARFDHERDIYEHERVAYEAARDRYEHAREAYNRYDGPTWRGQDGRTYCRKSDGTTGLIVGGVAGALLGNVIDGGRHRAAGTLIGGGAGALIGKSVEQNQQCR